MTIRKKTLLILTGTSIFLMTTFVAISVLLDKRNVLDLEKDLAARNIERAVRAIESRIEEMKRASSDLSSVFAKYHHASDELESKVSSFCVNIVTKSHNINGVALFDSNGEAIFSKSMNIEREMFLKVSEKLQEIIRKGRDPNPNNQDFEVLAGVWSFDDKPVFIVCRSSFLGEHGDMSYGLVGLFSFFNSPQLFLSEELDSSHLKLLAYDLPSLPPDFLEAKAELLLGEPRTIHVNKYEAVYGYALLRDFNDEPTFILRTEMPRTIVNNARAAAYRSLTMLLFACIAFYLTVAFLMDRFVLVRLSNFKQQVDAISRNESKSRRISTDNKADELGSLAQNINEMLDAQELAQAEIKKAEARYRRVVEDQTELVCRFLPEGDINFANQAFCNFSGKDLDEVLGENINSILPQLPVSSLFSVDPTVSIELPMSDLNGNLRWQSWRFRGLFNEQEELTEFQGVGRDITEKKQAIDELAGLAEAVNNAAEAIIVTNLKGFIKYVNPTFEEMLGYSKTELLGRSILRFQDINLEDEVYKGILSALEQRRVWHGRIPSKTINGEILEISWTISPVKNADGKIQSYVSIGRDLTEIQSMEKQLLQAQKLEAIGGLASGIAHEFGNVLQIISGHAQLLEISASCSEEDMEYIQVIRKASKRAAKVVEDLLAFSRKSIKDSELKQVDLNGEIRRIVKLLRQTLPRMIEIDLNLSDDIGQILCHQGELELILLNLASNAKDAMPEEGRLSIITERKDIIRRREGRPVGLRSGEYGLLRVRDTGKGIPQDEMSRIYDPFFTTKPVGEGTGLGLAAVYGIVAKSNGSISCDSQVGQGTEFRILLPSATKGNAEILLKTEDDSQFTIFHENKKPTVLIVEDEDVLRQMTKKTLEKRGFEVFEAPNGVEAIDLFCKNKYRIDAVLMDIGLPGMSGISCLQQILNINPKANIIIASAYSQRATVQQALSTGAKAYVAKPYDWDYMENTIISVINKFSEAPAS